MISYNQFESVPQNGIISQREGGILRLWFDIEKHEMPEPEEGESEVMPRSTADEYVCYNVDVRGDATYAAVVAAIVNDRYSNDDVQALQANYIEAIDSDSTLADEKRDEYLEEWREFQQWRAKAKEIAAKTVTMINND